MFPRPAFFHGARLNFAENLLYPKCNPDEHSFAVIEANESTLNFVTWRELRERVRELSVALRTLGIKQGERVAGYVANHCNALVAMLAATSIGAIVCYLFFQKISYPALTFGPETCFGIFCTSDVSWSSLVFLTKEVLTQKPSSGLQCPLILAPMPCWIESGRSSP